MKFHIYTLLACLIVQGQLRASQASTLETMESQSDEIRKAQREMLGRASIGSLTPSMLEQYLKQGVDINARDMASNSHKPGFTALMYLASTASHSVTIEALIKAGANPNIQDSRGKWTALTLIAERLASKNERLVIPVTKMLLKAGANVNHIGLDSTTALGEAAKNSNIPLVRLLLNAGEKPDHLKKALDDILRSRAPERAQGMQEVLDDFLRQHIQELKNVAQKTLAANLPLSAQGAARQLAPAVQEYLRPAWGAQEKADVEMIESE